MPPKKGGSSKGKDESSKEAGKDKKGGSAVKVMYLFIKLNK